MKSRTGYIQYLQFTAGSNKGGVKQGDVFNDVFHLGKMNESRANYTAAAVVEPVKETDTECVLSWTPVVDGSVFGVAANGTKTALTPVDGKVTFEAGTYVKVAYQYNNVEIPQNDLPILNAHMEGISLEAKARRIAVYYSQMAAFQAKTEMGVDLGEILASQACGELSYEIDTEIVNLLTDNATYFEDLEWNKTRPIGVNIRDHYESFNEMVQKASQHIYDMTQKYRANYLIVASDIIPVLSFVAGFKATDKIGVGPYFAGTVNGVKVYVSPVLEPGTYVAGFNGGDMVTSAAVFAPYMAIVPTQLLGFADGAMSQGFSSLYDVKLLNTALIVKGKVVEKPQDIHIAG